jgi:hypothetical protein
MKCHPSVGNAALIIHEPVTLQLWHSLEPSAPTAPLETPGSGTPSILAGELNGRPRYVAMARPDESGQSLIQQKIA